MNYAYDTENIFAKILRGEIPNTTVVETDHCLAFHDIAPQAPVHILVIPKGAYVNFDHFAAQATAEEIVDFTKTIKKITSTLGVNPDDEGAGYRLISNSGVDGMQEVPHLHVHILAGKPLGPLVVTA